MIKHHLNETLLSLKGPTTAQITVNNQWAAVALDRFHTSSTAILNLNLDGKIDKIELTWDSDFSKSAMKEEVYMAFNGGEAIAMFVMSVLCDYQYLEQSEIGTGVDYRFMRVMPDDLNFMNEDHFVEISGILQESRTNTLLGRVKQKHKQISEGSRNYISSSVIVTHFKEPKTIKEKHK